MEDGPATRLSILASSLALDALLCYVLDLHGGLLMTIACLAWLPFVALIEFCRIAIGPGVVIDRPKYGDVDFHITGPPGGSKK